VLVNGA